MIDGKRLNDLRINTLRSELAYVPQETFLFSGTIADNIRYGNPMASDEEVQHAVSLASASEFVHALKDGIHTGVGDGGLRLSRGQQQRIALARAIVADPAILILDEATSDIDTESEHEIQKALVNVLANRTSFVIAHRLSTIRNADVILVLENGQIIQQGTHDELVSQPGAYYELHTAQARI